MKNPLLVTLVIAICLTLSEINCGNEGNRSEVLKYTLSEVTHSDYRWTGVAVSKKGRIFVNYPRWSDNIPFSVGEITKSKEVKTYPDEEWNNWDSLKSVHDHFICVQSVYVDQNDNLWILDPANPLFGGVIEGGPKLLKVDLESNQVIQTILFDTTITVRNSYLNDVRVDVKTNTAYITDSGYGAIIVVNLNTSQSRRVLSNHSSTKAEDITLKIANNELSIKVHSDGIALDNEQDYLYYQALTGYHLYRIKTDYLRDQTIPEVDLGSKVELVGKSGASDGLFFKDGFIYLTSIEHNAIKRITRQGEVQLVVEDTLLEWPDSFSRSADGEIYVTTSRIGFPADSKPFRLFKLISGN